MELKQYILNKIKGQSTRNKNISKHVIISFIYKGGSILSSFLLVPLTINYLDQENYGIWLTLSSFIAWFSFFDIGLGHGLRNKFAEARANNDMFLAKAYVSTAYFTIAVISFATFVSFFFINYFVNWANVFNTNTNLSQNLNILMPIVFGFFCLRLVLKLVTNVYLANQNHSMQGKVSFYISIISLFIVWIITQFSGNSLLLFGTIFSAIPAVLLVILNIYGFTHELKNVKPSLSFFKLKYLKSLMGLGFTFFIIQISGIILFSTDNFIISKLFSPAEVVPYTIAYKYFSIISMVFTIILTPYWSSFTDAFAKKDFVWIKNSMSFLIKLMFGFIFLLMLMLFLSNKFYSLWLGDKIIIPINLSFSMAAYFLVSLVYTPFTYFINGIGKIRLQMYSILFTAIVNIPLSIFLAHNFKTIGVIIATTLCILPHAILCPIQFNKLINGKANGIWNM